MNPYVYLLAALICTGIGAGIGYPIGAERATTRLADAQRTALADKDATIASLNADAETTARLNREELARRDKREAYGNELFTQLTDQNKLLAVQLTTAKRAIQEEATRDPSLAVLLRTAFPTAFRERMRDEAAAMSAPAHH